MASRIEQIERQVEVLKDFEMKYRAYLADFEHGQGTEEWLDPGGPADVLDDDPGWSAEESAARKRKLSELAPAADRAMRDSGVGVPALGRSWAQGGGPIAASLPSMIFYHGPIELDESGTAMQRRLLELIPAAVGGLKMQLEEERHQGTIAMEPKLPKRGLYWPRVVFGRLKFVPPMIGFIADLGGCVVVIYAVGRFIQAW